MGRGMEKIVLTPIRFHCYNSYSELKKKRKMNKSKGEWIPIRSRYAKYRWRSYKDRNWERFAGVLIVASMVFGVIAPIIFENLY